MSEDIKHYVKYTKKDISPELQRRFKGIYNEIEDNHSVIMYLGTTEYGEKGATVYTYSLLLFFFLMEYGYYKMADELGKATRYEQIVASTINVETGDWQGVQPLIDKGVSTYEQNQLNR